ncbi:MAG: 1-acyl-sn-glycerol-3-phosphate acyltransferase [Burkholderiales bacterium]|jgi:1-acyl-sn-glycerol-3-phosphate acyltransferase|nr:1-acyl-sn-glycerol-3-phosphate acyltransferase [Burkholderiales bacterium]
MSSRSPRERLRQVVRLSQLAAHVGLGLALSASFPLQPARARRAWFRWWSKRLLRIVRVRVRVHGDLDALPSGAPALLLSNHVSWLDVFVVRASVECRFVAKSDIRDWPVLGWLVACQGTVFVQRTRRADTARVNASLASALARGEPMVVFPEGTTTDGTEVRAFHASLLQPVVAVSGYAVPVALRYRDASGARSDAAAYAGDRSLWDSAKLLTAEREVHADVHFLAPLAAAERHRRELAQAAAAAVATALGLPLTDKARPEPDAAASSSR